MNFLAQKRKKILLDKHSPNSSRENPFNDFYYKEIAQLTGAGGYNVDFLNKTSSIDPQGKRILNIVGEFNPTLSDLLALYVEEEQERVIETFMACAAGTPFKTTVKMRKISGEEFWAKAIGKPKYAKNGQVIGIQGVFQDVTSEKEKADELEKSLKTIASKNSQLLNFAHLVSHNLKSNVSNLNVAMELLQQSENKNQETELIEGMNSIAEELCNTVKNLAQVVSIQESSNAQKEKVTFQDVLQNIKKELEDKIAKSRTEIFSDF